MMSLVKDYGRIKIYNRSGHFEIWVDNEFEVSCDNWTEVREELQRIDEELNREA
jgi:hypothetical protein